MWKTGVFAFSVAILLLSNSAYARFGVQLPFLDNGQAYQCMQNSNDTPTHKGLYTKYDLDFGMKEQTLIVAAAGGIVEKVERNCVVGRDCGKEKPTDSRCNCGGKFGNHIKIKHDDGHSTLYAHLQYHGVIVNVGDEVIAGQPIGFSGNTGRSGGPHLHYGMHEPSKKRVGKSISDIEIWSHDHQTGQDIWRRVDVSRSDSRAFHCYINAKNKGHSYEAMDINGFNFSAFQCSGVGNNTVHCWRGEKDSTGRYHMAWCDEAYYHIKYYKDSDGYHSQELSTSDGQNLCSQNQGEVGLLAFLGGSYGVGGAYTPPSANYTNNGTGAVEHSQPGESDHAGYKHNVSMDDTELARAGTDSYDRKWTFYHGEVPVVNVRTKLHNKTNHEIGKNDVTIKWYESPNKTFNPDHDHHFATDHNKHSIEAFEHNSHSDELVERKTGITYLQTLAPGIYYLYPIFYYNGEENMASNHDHGEYIKVTILPKYDVQATQFTTNKSTVVVGEDFTLTAGLSRNYDYLPHDVRVGFYITGGNLNNKLFYAKLFTPDQLGSQTFNIPTLAPLNPGSYTITMKVDDEGRLGEVDEGNNQRSLSLTVNGIPVNGVVDTNYGSTDSNSPKVVPESLIQGHCLAGRTSALSGRGRPNNPWQWTCQGEYGGTDQIGYAVLNPTIVAKMIPDDIKRQIFWWLKHNRLERQKEEQERKEALKLPVELRRQIFWLLRKNRQNQ